MFNDDRLCSPVKHIKVAAAERDVMKITAANFKDLCTHVMLER